MSKVMSQEKIDVLVAELGKSKTVLMFYDLMPEDYLKEFTFDDWKEFYLDLLNVPGSAEIVIKNLSNLAKDKDELLYVYKVSENNSEIELQTKERLDAQDCSLLWWAQQLSANIKSLGSKKVVELAKEKIKNFEM